MPGESANPTPQLADSLSEEIYAETETMLRRPLPFIALWLALMLPLWADDKPLSLDRAARPLILPAAAPVGSVTFSVNTGAVHQPMDGFGGEYIGFPIRNATQIAQVLTLAFGQVQLTLGNADQVLEATAPTVASSQDSSPGNALSVDQNAASW